MKHKLSYRQKVNLRYVVSILFTLLLLLNLITNLVNTNFKNKKINEENLEIVELTTYLINDHNVEFVIEYLEHYKESHHIDFSIHKANGDLVYSSTGEKIEEFTATISTDNEGYVIGIDNTHSTTVDLLNSNIYYTNIAIIALSITLIVIMIYSNKLYHRKIKHDLESITHFIRSEEFTNQGFNYEEFEEIYDGILEYTKRIDVLNEQKKLSVTGLAHDIKTPLTIIKSYLNPYKELDNTITKEKCLNAVDRISKLMDHLRKDDYAGAFYSFDISKLIKQEMQSYYSIFNHKSISISLDLAENPHVKWNMKHARIVIDNLLSNAYYYSKPNSKYTIRSRIKEDSIVIKFTSQGNPINIQEKDAIFQKGYRSSSTIEFNQDGEGIGLYIIKILLLAADAHIDLEVVGDKNVFIITLPLQKEQ